MGKVASKTEALMLTKRIDHEVKYFPLPGLLPKGQLLALHLELRTLSLLCDGPRLLKQQQFSESELRVILPLLEAYPYYSPYEVLVAHVSTRVVTASLITECHQRLQEAHQRKTLRQELKPVRRAISSLRTKLHHFQLEISVVREEGCNLTLLMTMPFL